MRPTPGTAARGGPGAAAAGAGRRLRRLLDRLDPGDFALEPGHAGRGSGAAPARRSAGGGGARPGPAGPAAAGAGPGPRAAVGRRERTSAAVAACARRRSRAGLASRRSVLAKRPAARAKSRIWRGLTTATAKPAACRLPTSRRSIPPVASTTTSATARVPSHARSRPIPPGSWPNRLQRLGQEMDVEAPLADVDADELARLFGPHHPVLACGLAALSTVRVE